MYIVCYTHKPAHQSLAPMTLVHFPITLKNIKVDASSRTKDPKLGTSFLQFSRTMNMDSKAILSLCICACSPGLKVMNIEFILKLKNKAQ